ncbi:hypothetical protein BCR33DRAFT_721943 [Rhizoclosmatium globosum]|uniref:Presequence translocated-associated motor subunit PAM17 n=1 Tax=Rhizoclosmatium globosum TaxID=329046 RepID=A0A1Y2BPT0_9FUNG|nr:hypothetical protein BCR33DRAFT_721943 [Rhizoclosmatium globosum]|eukprot:ORY36736.1 hypothetical protein BCR33DRAFT_721943 [Rhizoclosmatium globosum]
MSQLIRAPLQIHFRQLLLNTRTRLFSSTTTNHQLSWTQYFTHRAQYRSYERKTGLIGACIATLGLASYFTFIREYEEDELVRKTWREILYFQAFLMLLVTAPLGYLAGVTVGARLWRQATPRNLRVALDHMEKELHTRIHKIRPNDWNNQLQYRSEAAPDWHGEKIDSVQAYRTWVRNHKRFNIKMYGGQQFAPRLFRKQ